MLIKILGNFSYQCFPDNDELAEISDEERLVEVSDEDIKEIGKTKQFDVENQRVIDYTPDTSAAERRREIFELKSKLKQTDYQAIKYAEGFISEKDYAEIKAQRQAWRDRINELEAEDGI